MPWERQVVDKKWKRDSLKVKPHKSLGKKPGLKILRAACFLFLT